MLDLSAPPRDPAIAAALGQIRRAFTEAQVGPPRDAGPRLLVACSGGADSMATLGLLALLQRSEGYVLHVGHVDHGLRPESPAEAARVREIGAALGVSVAVEVLTLERGPGLPARARDARRAALGRMAQAAGAPFIVLAHTATDQAETMLMHLARGSGLDGLAAMPILDAPWLRPVLGLTRAQTRALATRLDLPFIDDPTNEDRDQLRVWLRHEVLGKLRGDNPRVELLMAGLARDAGDAQEALEAWARREVSSRRLHSNSYSLQGFHRLPRAIRTRVLRHICELATVDLCALHRRTLEGIEGAATAMAEAIDQGKGARKPAPRRWDLHPQRELAIDKNGVSVGPAAGLGG